MQTSATAIKSSSQNGGAVKSTSSKSAIYIALFIGAIILIALIVVAIVVVVLYIKRKKEPSGESGGGSSPTVDREVFAVTASAPVHYNSTTLLSIIDALAKGEGANGNLSSFSLATREDMQRFWTMSVPRNSISWCEPHFIQPTPGDSNIVGYVVGYPLSRPTHLLAGSDSFSGCESSKGGLIKTPDVTVSQGYTIYGIKPSNLSVANQLLASVKEGEITFSIKPANEYLWSLSRQKSLLADPSKSEPYLAILESTTGPLGSKGSLPVDILTAVSDINANIFRSLISQVETLGRFASGSVTLCQFSDLSTAFASSKPPTWCNFGITVVPDNISDPFTINTLNVAYPFYPLSNMSCTNGLNKFPTTTDKVGIILYGPKLEQSEHSFTVNVDGLEMPYTLQYYNFATSPQLWSKFS